MYSLYFFIAAGVLAAAFALKKLLKPSNPRTLSPFQQSRPMPDLQAPNSSEEQRRAQEGLLKVADEATIRPFNAPEITRHQSVTQPVASALASNAMNGGAGNDRSSSATVPMSSAGSSNRISTWHDRRLFQDFRGILNDNTDSIPLPSPEEMPVRNDDYVFGSLTPSIAQLLPETDARKTAQRKTLLAAGYHSRASSLNLSAIRFTLSFLALVIVGFWLIMAPPAIEPWLLALLVIAPPFMWALPPLMVNFKAAERKIDIERGLPDVLDMMNMGVSQGLTVPQSLRRISRELSEVHPALAEELRIVDQQAEVGNLPQALRNFGQRIDSPEVTSFTSLLIQSETTGTSISKALTDYSDSIRASLKERADSRANAASFKLLFPVALFLMPSVFLFLLGPAIVQMSDFFNNQAQDLQQDRNSALRSLDQQPQLDMRRFGAPGGAFGGTQP